MGGSRSTILILVLTGILLLAYKVTFAPKVYKEASHNTNYIFLFIFSLLVVFLTISQTELGSNLFESNLTRIESIQEGNVGARDRLWMGSIQVAMKNPLGVGSNNSLIFLSEEIGFGGLIDAHNYYLRILMEGGFIGFIAFIWGIKFIIQEGWRWMQKSGDATFFFPFIFILFVALSGVNFHLKIAWFFLAMNAVTPTTKIESKEF
jgi:O-antigen ligase